MVQKSYKDIINFDGLKVQNAILVSSVPINSNNQQVQKTYDCPLVEC
jgi:hypothetical protein